LGATAAADELALADADVAELDDGALDEGELA
jgi:hypothetical protein